MIALGKKSLNIPLPILLAIVGGGLSIVLFVGLMSGLVGRPNSKEIDNYDSELIPIILHFFLIQN
jgi:hypothetical protein